MPKKLPQISDAEWEVMKVLWDHQDAHRDPCAGREGPGPGLSALQVIERLARAEDPSAQNWAPQTVKTLLSRLVRKRAVAYITHGKTYEYHPIVSRDEVARAESRTFLSRVFGSRRPVSQMLAHLVEGEELTSDEIEACRRLLDRAEERQKGDRVKGGGA